jgi:hypothetical protein
MKTVTLSFFTALAMALAGATLQAQSDPPPPPPAGSPPPPPAFAQILKDIVQKYDVNQDGQLDQSEMAALMKDIADGKIQPPPPPFGPGPHGTGGPGPGPLPRDILDKYDTNHVGQLDETEWAALQKDIKAGKIQLPPPGPGFGPPPSAKDILVKFDVDKDGKLDEAELTAFLEDVRQHRPPPPPPDPPGGPIPGNPSPTNAPPRQ